MGRMGDLHSGYQGLSVTVNGQAASVSFGTGNNGTFVLAAAPPRFATRLARTGPLGAVWARSVQGREVAPWSPAVYRYLAGWQGWRGCSGASDGEVRPVNRSRAALPGVCT